MLGQKIMLQGQIVEKPSVHPLGHSFDPKFI